LELLLEAIEVVCVVFSGSGGRFMRCERGAWPRRGICIKGTALAFNFLNLVFIVLRDDDRFLRFLVV
jgi:hypothetical protein